MIRLFRRSSPNTPEKHNIRHTVVRFRYASAARSVYGSLLFLLSLVALAASAQAEWKVLSAESEPGRSGFEHRHVIVEDAAAGQRVAVDVAVFSAKSTALRVIDNPDGQSSGRGDEARKLRVRRERRLFRHGIQAARLASCRCVRLSRRYAGPV